MHNEQINAVGKGSGKVNIMILYLGRKGGGARYSYEVSKNMPVLPGCNVHLCISRQSDLYVEMKALGVPVLEIDTYDDFLSAAMATLRLPAIAKRVSDYVNNNDIDIVIATMSHIWNAALIKSIKRSGAHYVLIMHDANPHPGENFLIRGRLLRYEAANSDSIISLTDYVKNRITNLYAIPGTKIGVVPHGAFTYPAGSTEQSANYKTILFFGRCLPYKGIDILLESFEIISRRHHDVKLAIIGPGDLSPYKKRINSMTRVAIDNRWIPEDEIGEIFSSAHIVVLPYIEASQSGVVAVAFGAGVPVVVTPVGGLAQQVVDGLNGIVADSISPLSLADGVERLLSDNELYRKCAMNALRAANAELSWPIVSSKIFDFCKTQLMAS